jgi:hypothetical protein
LGGRVKALAVAADGSRVYAGVEARETITEIRTDDMTVVREIVLPLAFGGFPYATAYALAVDPTDARRIAALAAPRGGVTSHGGVVLIFEDGVREQARTSRTGENEGFNFYQASDLRWSSDGMHLLVWSTAYGYRLRTRIDPLLEEGLLDSFATGNGAYALPFDLAGSTWMTRAGQLATHDFSMQRLLQAPSGFGLGFCRPLDASQAFCMDNSFDFGGPNFIALSVADGEPLGLFTPDFPVVAGCGYVPLESVAAIDGGLVLASSRCREADPSAPSDQLLLLRLPGY